MQIIELSEIPESQDIEADVRIIGSGPAGATLAIELLGIVEQMPDPDSHLTLCDRADHPIRVFVHLAHGFGGRSWERGWKEGKILGINEPLPYGYYRANKMGCSVTHSQDRQETAPTRFFRLAMRAILGFDLIHAWRNFEGIRNADVVWTHTESQFLSILLLLRSRPRSRRPKLIAQSVWLFDQWHKFFALKRWLLSILIKKADILTVLSPENLAVAKRLFPEVRSELVLFGIAADAKKVPTLRPVGVSLNIVSLGNDEHRDWSLLIDAISNQEDWTLKIASQQIKTSSIGNATNVEIVKLKTNDELFALYQWADVLVLAIKPNLHASGITVIQEAALQGVPVICSDTGGLRTYFSDTEVYFVPPRDARALRNAIQHLADHPDVRLALARKAQARMGLHGLSSEAFVRRHVAISQDLLTEARDLQIPVAPSIQSS
jgi:glycosyltransferase involved in cell wall biosynthesis